MQEGSKNMQLIKLAVNLNNKGVSFHQRENQEHSWVMFTAACTIMQFCCRNDDNREGIDNNNAEEENNNNNNQDYDQRLDMLVNNTHVQNAMDLLSNNDVTLIQRTSSSSSNSEDNEDLYFVYKEALKINDDFVEQFHSTAATNDEDVRHAICKACSSVILYNLALLCHLKHVHKPTGSQYEVQRATTFYNMAGELITEEDMGERISFHLQDLLIVLSNNVAVLNYQQGLYFQSRQCLDLMLACIAERRTSAMSLTAAEAIAGGDAVENFTTQVTKIKNNSCISEMIMNCIVLNETNPAKAA